MKKQYLVEVFQVQRENLAYQWNDVALLTDQRAYTIICKTMLQIAEQDVYEVQEVVLLDWVWQTESFGGGNQDSLLVPFQGNVTLQIYYLNRELQQGIFFVDVPIQGAWEEPFIQQNSMRLVFSNTQIAERDLLLETVLQISRNQPLERSQVIIGSFQQDSQIQLTAPWPECHTILGTNVILQLKDWKIDNGAVQLCGEQQLICIYQNVNQTGEQVFVYEQRIPLDIVLAVPQGLCELDGIMPYYQTIIAQVQDEQHILMSSSGVFCTLPVELEPIVEKIDCARHMVNEQLSPPSVVNSRGSRRAKLSKYMRNLNQSVETPTSIRNFEIRDMEKE